MPDVPPVTRTFFPFSPRMPSDTRAAAVMLMGVAPSIEVWGLIQRRFINRAAPMPVESAITAGCYIDLRNRDSRVPMDRDACGVGIIPNTSRCNRGTVVEDRGPPAETPAQRGRLAAPLRCTVR